MCRLARISFLMSIHLFYFTEIAELLKSEVGQKLELKHLEDVLESTTM